MGRAILVTSGKGGTGKTSLTAGVGSCLAALGHKTICVDADVGLRNLDIALGVSDRAVLDFGDVLRDHELLGDALREHPQIPNLFLLPAPTGLQAAAIDAGAFAELVQDLCEQAEFVFVDSAAGLDAGFGLAAGACREAIVVATPDPLSVRDAARAASLLDGYDTVRLVLNRVRPRLMHRKLAPNVDDVMDEVGLSLLGVVPEDEMVLAAAARSTPVILAARNGAAVTYLNIAERLLGKKVNIPRIRQWSLGG